MIRYGVRPITGFGIGETLTPPVATPGTSPWPMVLASSVVSAATGWAIEEVVRRTIRKKKR